MSRTKIIFFGGQKGGTGKTSTALLFCLGAVLRKQPAAYVLTDPQRTLKPNGRPFGVIDGRDPAKLAKLIEASQATQNGWLVIDGGGNRQAFDEAVAKIAGLSIIPFRDSEEDLEPAVKDLIRLQNSFALPTAWPTNPKAQEAVSRFLDAMEHVHPMRVLRPVYFVHSVFELLGESLENPSSTVRNAARRVFDHISEAYEEHEQTEGNEKQAAVA